MQNIPPQDDQSETDISEVLKTCPSSYYAHVLDLSDVWNGALHHSGPYKLGVKLFFVCSYTYQTADTKNHEKLENRDYPDMKI